MGITLQNFTKNDWFGFQGAEEFADGSAPRIYYFTPEESSSLMSLLGVPSNPVEDGEYAYILHHGEGLVVGWFYGQEYPQVEWKAGAESEGIETLLGCLDSTTLPIWVASVVKAAKQDC